MEKYQLICSKCHKNIYRHLGRVNEAKKFAWKAYCSSRCQSESRKTGTQYSCSECGNKIWRTPNDLRKNKHHHFFCSSSCAAKHNNHYRIGLRYMGTLPHKPRQKCRGIDCNNLAGYEAKYCSRTCAASVKKKDNKVLAKEVLERIRKFKKLNGRIPVKKEMYGPYRKARRAFGAWNNAIIAAGFKPNPVLFANKYFAKDGHRCDSFAEKIIDDWLDSHGISHSRTVPYPEGYKLTCDFVVNNHFIEFFGLDGQVKDYTRLANKKRGITKKHNIRLIELKPNDLFPKNKLDQILGFLI